MKQLLIIALLALSLVGASQNNGIQFLNDTIFENVLARAKAENKLIFIDCYTVWCGPCKYMDANIFPDEKLGEFHNTHFINLKYDMEKPYGMVVRKKYGIKAYPSFLYLDGNGEVIHRFVGSTIKPEDFLEVSRKALDTEDNFKAVNQRILQGDRRASTISNYLSLNYGAANADTLVNDHFNLVTDAEKLSNDTWKMMKSHGTSYNGVAFQYFKNNRKAYSEAFSSNEVEDYLYRVMSNTYRMSPNEYQNLKNLDPVIFERHQREMNFRKANGAFSRDKTNKDAWKEYIARAEEFISGNSPQAGFINSIAQDVLANYSTFNDQASVVKALGWVKNALKANPDNKDLTSIQVELLKATGGKK